LFDGNTDIHKNLVEESKKGSSKAQYKLYKLYAGAMFNTSFRLMRNREEAEDMLQESFSEAFMNLDRFRFESTFGAWLKRIVVNKCINEIKRKKADLEYTDDIARYSQKEADNDLPILSVDKVKEAMEHLPGGSRMIFQLYLLEGYDHREIAEILGVSESNSKSQYMRAKRRIKEILKDEIYEN
jgi:RNA polymerase sigma factor (sigma-70 family)